MSTIPESVTYPLPQDNADLIIEDGLDVDPAVLVALAVGYQMAQSAVSRASEQAAMSLFIRLQPVTDADMATWMDGWNGLLAASQDRQYAITSDYARRTMSTFGVNLQPDVEVKYDEKLWKDLEKWTKTPYAQIASRELRTDVDDALKRIADGKAMLKDAHLADRILNLHAPVVKARQELSNGVTGGQAFNNVSDHVGRVTYNVGRSAEGMATDRAGWPMFKNGSAMLYRRVPAANACGWCVIVSTRVYTLASFRAGRAWHGGCRCSWRPLTRAEASSYALTYRETQDYFQAAETIGAWSGPAPDNYNDWIAKNRFGSGDSTVGAGATLVGQNA